MEEFLVIQIWCDPRITFCWHPVETCIYCCKEQRIGFWNPWDSKTIRSKLQGNSSSVEAIVLSCLSQVYIYLLFLRLVHLKGLFHDTLSGPLTGVIQAGRCTQSLESLWVPPGSFGQFSLTTSSLTFKSASCISCISGIQVPHDNGSGFAWGSASPHSVYTCLTPQNCKFWANLMPSGGSFCTVSDHRVAASTSTSQWTSPWWSRLSKSFIPILWSHHSLGCSHQGSASTKVWSHHIPCSKWRLELSSRLVLLLLNVN